jgi:chromosome segregation ATPase
MGSGDITKELSDGQFARILSELAELRAIMNGFGNKIASLDNRVASLDNRVASLETRVGAVEAKVDALETTVENRLKETRPLWEVVIARLDGLQGDLDNLHGDVDRGFRKMSVFADDVIQVRADQRHLEDRLDKIEKLQHQ